MQQLSVTNVDPAELEKRFRATLETEIDTVSVIPMLESGDASFTLVDVRDAEAFEKGHVKGSINLPFEELGKRMSEIPKEKPVLVSCYNHECLLSTRAARQLAGKGYRVMDVAGGFERFEQNGAPIEKGAAKVDASRTPSSN